MVGLNELSLHQLPISSIAAIGTLTSLRKLSLVEIPVVDISPLLALPALVDLAVGRSPVRLDILSELERRGVNVRSW